MSEYRTEFIVPPDRYLCLQLPPHLPEGKVTVTVTVHAPDPAPANPAPAGPGPDSAPDDDLDHQDIEWWEEFEDEERGMSAGEEAGDHQFPIS